VTKEVAISTEGLRQHCVSKSLVIIKTNLRDAHGAIPSINGNHLRSFEVFDDDCALGADESLLDWNG
jgi:hypothetical protein